MPGSAAANSPLEVGEVIQSVNGTDCSYCSTDHLADLLLGPEGSVVNVLTIARGGRPKSINLERGLPWDEVVYLSIDLSICVTIDLVSIDLSKFATHLSC